MNNDIHEFKYEYFEKRIANEEEAIKQLEKFVNVLEKLSSELNEEMTFQKCSQFVSKFSAALADKFAELIKEENKYFFLGKARKEIESKVSGFEHAVLYVQAEEGIKAEEIFLVGFPSKSLSKRRKESLILDKLPNGDSIDEWSRTLFYFEVFHNGKRVLFVSLNSKWNWEDFAFYECEFIGENRELFLNAITSLRSLFEEELKKLMSISSSKYLIPKYKLSIDNKNRMIRRLFQQAKKWESIAVTEDNFVTAMNAATLFIEADDATPPGMLLIGKSGLGKKYFAKEIGDSAYSSLIDIPPNQMADIDWVNRTLYQLVEECKKGARFFLHIEDAEKAFPAQHSKLWNPNVENIVDYWKRNFEEKELHKIGIWFVFSTEHEGELHPIMLNIFKRCKLKFTAPNYDFRKLALDAQVDNIDVPEFVYEKTNGFSYRDLVELFADVKRFAFGETIGNEHWHAAIRHIRKSSDSSYTERSWESLVLDEPIKQKLISLSTILSSLERWSGSGIEPPKGALLYGPPGTGKTEIARTLANECGVSFSSVTTTDFKAEHIGGSAQNVKRIFQEARSKAPAILFIDEIDAVAPDRSGDHADQFTTEIVNQLLQEIDGVKDNSSQHVFVLTATNLVDRVDPAILSRLKEKIEIPLPNLECRKQQLLNMLKRHLTSQGGDPGSICLELAKVLTGRSGREIKTFVSSALEAAAFKAGSPELLEIDESFLLAEANKLMANLSKRDVTKTWDQLVLNEKVLARLKTITKFLKNSESFIRQGVQPPKGVIFYGPPGTGKTEIARTMSNESLLPFFSFSSSDIKSEFIGKSGSNVKKVFEKARLQAPSIVFLDELDAIAPKRGSENADKMSDDIVNQLLQELDGFAASERPVFLLAATNNLENIDDALLSRLSERIEIPLPDMFMRERIFKNLLSKNSGLVDFNLEEGAQYFSKKSEGLSGRDIKNAVSRAIESNTMKALDNGGPVLLSASLIEQELRPDYSAEVSDSVIEDAWDKIVIKSEIRNSIINSVKAFNKGAASAPKGLLLYGPPGTGKTHLARTIAACTNSEFISLNNADLKGSHIGGSGERVKKLWERARAKGRCVIFVDECDGVFARRGSEHSDSLTQEIVQGFLAEWDGIESAGLVWVIGATNRRELLDDAILSRFGQELEIPLPSREERQQIIQLELGKLEVNVYVPEFVFEATSGMSGRNLATICKDVCVLAGELAPTESHWKSVIGKNQKLGSTAVDSDAKWDNLILESDTISKLKTMCGMLKNVEVLSAQGITPPSGLLLYGPPGTGKTQIARTLANESGLSFIGASTADLKAGYVGQSGERVKQLFEKARSRSPAILFIDEIESVTPKRGGRGSDVMTTEIVTQLLQEMDGVKSNKGHVFVLSASNIPEAIDDAIVSRFSDRIEIPLPSIDSLALMISNGLRELPNVKFDISKISFHVAQLYVGKSGRDIKSLLSQIQQSAVKRAIETDTADNVQILLSDIEACVPKFEVAN